jgi:glycosyltransferase A (GT-A) superfamily protein (DUF2064 family)
VTPTILLVAKAPVPGLVKTRLAAEVGESTATEVAAAALLDTIDACTTAVGPDRCHLALSGDVEAAYRADEIHAAVAGWTITPQRGTGFGERLANPHEPQRVQWSRQGLHGLARRLHPVCHKIAKHEE